MEEAFVLVVVIAALASLIALWKTELASLIGRYKTDSTADLSSEVTPAPSPPELASLIGQCKTDSSSEVTPAPSPPELASFIGHYKTDSTADSPLEITQLLVHLKLKEK